MKKRYIFLIVKLIFIGVLIYALTSPFIFRYIANSLSKDFNLSYKKIEGTIIGGFVIKDLKYKNRDLAKEIILKPNFLSLFHGKISLNEVKLKDVNKDTLEDMVNDFSSKKDSSSKSNNSSFSISMPIDLENIEISLTPFKIDKFLIKKSYVKVDYIKLDSNGVEIGDLEEYMNSSIGEFKFRGSFKNKILDIKKLEANRVNLEVLSSFLTINRGKSDSNLTIFTPKIVKANSVEASIRDSKLFNIDIKSAKIDGKDILFDVKKAKFEKLKLDIELNSSIGNIALRGKLNSKEAIIDYIHLSGIDIEKLLAISNFPLEKKSSQKNKSSKNNSIISYPKDIKLKEITLELKDKKIKGVDLKKFYLKGEYLIVDLDKKNLNLDHFILNLKAEGIDELSLNGYLKDKILYIDNIKAIASIKKILKISKKFSSSNKSKENNSSSLKIAFIKSIYFYKGDFLIKDIEVDDFLMNKLKISTLKGEYILDKNLLNIDSLRAKATSNWGRANLKGYISKNILYAKGGELFVDQKLFKNFKLPLIAKGFKSVKFSGSSSFDRLKLKANIKAKNFLEYDKSLEIKSSIHTLNLKYKSGDLIWNILDAKMRNSQFDFDLKGSLTNRDGLKYKAFIKNIKFITLKEYQKYITSLKLVANGSTKGVNIDIDSSDFRGKLLIKNYKKAKLTLNSKRAILIDSYYKLPDFLKGAKEKIKIVSKEIYIKNLKKIPFKIEANGNLAKIKGDIELKIKDSVKGDLIVDISRSSILAKEIKDINIKRLKPFRVKFYKDSFEISGNNLLIKKAKRLFISFSTLKGEIDSNMKNLKGKVSNINRFIIDINRYLKKPIKLSINGGLNFNIAFLKNIYRVNISSKRIIIDPKKSPKKIDNLKVAFDFNKINKKVTILSYNFNFNDYHFFSKRNSILSIKDIVTIEKFWINDSLVVNGNYNLAKKRGLIKFKSNNFELNNPDLKVKLRLNGTLKNSDEKVAISGRVTILGGKILKSFNRTKYAEDEDIIIIQREAKKKSTYFAKNVKLNLKVDSKAPIIYKHNGIYVKMLPKLTIKKEFNSLSNIKGVIKIKRGGYYIFQDKKLIFDDSYIKFNGKGTSPTLNIKLIYKGVEYKVFIYVQGSPTNPILHFRSSPPLRKSEILSYLVFGETQSATTKSSEAMLGMLGGTVAKSLLNSIGLKIDHLLVTQNEFEIGKRIGDRIFIYYDKSGDVSSIKVRVNITKSIHTNIKVSPESQSADIIFSKEY